MLRYAAYSVSCITSTMPPLYCDKWSFLWATAQPYLLSKLVPPVFFHPDDANEPLFVPLSMWYTDQTRALQCNINYQVLSSKPNEDIIFARTEGSHVSNRKQFVSSPQVVVFLYKNVWSKEDSVRVNAGHDATCSSWACLLIPVELGNQHEPLPGSPGISVMTALTVNSYSGTGQRNLLLRSDWHQKSMLDANFRISRSHKVYSNNAFLFLNMEKAGTNLKKKQKHLSDANWRQFPLEKDGLKNFPAVTNEWDRTCTQMNNRHLVSKAAPMIKHCTEAPALRSHNWAAFYNNLTEIWESRKVLFFFQ